MNEFSQALWGHDKRSLSEVASETAQAIFVHCTEKLESIPKQRNSSSISRSDFQTIFRTKIHKAFWLVLDFRKGHIEIHFPDKDDKIMGIRPLLANRAPGGQWTTKKEKRITIPDGCADFETIKAQIEEIHEGANDWYGRTDNYSETLHRLFGDPLRGVEMLNSPPRELFSAILEAPFCKYCNSSNNLNINLLKSGDHILVCDTHNPSKSKFLISKYYDIPHEVKRYVWHRDGGLCVSCGSKDYLTFDHMIPANRNGGAFRGSHSESNVRLKCRSCNYSKGNKLIP
jgi:hypothetical protein